MEQSPYLIHSEILIKASYGTACRLQEFALSLYDANKYSFTPNNHLGGFDTRHRAIYDELLNWYRDHGDDEPSFVAVCTAILAQREAEAHLEMVESMRETEAG
jgi:hypothetical protein